MKLKSLEEITKISQREKSTDKKIVFTNGCFDIIHAGHIQYLQEAKDLGDILVIGLNSDESVKRLKGNNRPLNDQHDRALVLSALFFVDYVVIFSEDTPYDLIKHIKPNILVKGGDWKTAEIVGADIVKAHNGEVKTLSFKKGISTTKIIERIRKL